MSLCDTCRDPGHCCRDFILEGKHGQITFWDDEIPRLDAMPFIPLRRQDQWTVEFGHEAGRTYSAWRWSCPKLGADGRCTVYADRPQLCRDYQAGSSSLCAEHELGKFRGIPIVVVEEAVAA